MHKLNTPQIKQRSAKKPQGSHKRRLHTLTKKTKRNKSKAHQHHNQHNQYNTQHSSSPFTQQYATIQTQLIDEKEPLNIETGPVRVRFAPSPTGTLHLGGLRTALYNLLFVKNRGGEMILRIEDTDRTRLVPGAVQSLIDDMRWVGITYDEGPEGIKLTIPSSDGQVPLEQSNPLTNPLDASPYTQSERFHLYTQASQRLLDKGHAYHCFCTPERLDQVRESRAAKGEPIIYDRLCSTLTHEEIEDKKSKGQTFVVRMKMPEGITLAKDLVRGEVKFQNVLIDDQVLIKSDGFPTYHLANIVDDHMMKITHVIRGEEWLPSLPKHVALYEMFGWEAPQFAHLPLLLREDGGKLSKRFRDSSLNYYVEMGYLPESIINFVALLGWHPTVDELQEHANIKAGIIPPTNAIASVKGSTISTTNSPSTTNTNITKKQPMDVTKLDPAALKALLTDDKTKLKQKTLQLAQSTVGGGGLNEVFKIDELSKYFNIHNIQKSGATVELNKLKFFHSQHWKRALNEDISRLEAFAAPHVHSFINRLKTNQLSEEDKQLLDGVEFNTTLSNDPSTFDQEYGLNTNYHKHALVSTINGGDGALYKPNQSIITALKTSRDHPYTLNEFPAKSAFVWSRPLLDTIMAQDLKKTFWISDENRTPKTTLTTPQVLHKIIDAIKMLNNDSIEKYDVAGIVELFKALGKTNKVSLKEIYLPLRFAFTGSLAGPGVADQLCAIGKDEAIARIEIVLKQEGCTE